MQKYRFFINFATLYKKLSAMKKIITLLTLSLFLAFSCYSQEQSYLMGIMKIGEINKLSAEGLQIKGKVKSIKTTNYKAVVVNGKIQKGEMSYRALRRDFDRNDDLVDPEPGDRKSVV